MKTAIRVNTEAEFKALMKHYEDKGFKSDACTVLKFDKQYPHLGYYDGWNMWSLGAGHEVVPFSVFSDLTGVKVEPEPIRVELQSGLYYGVIIDDMVTFENRAGEVMPRSKMTRADISAIHSAFKEV